MITITFSTANSAFEDDPHAEISSILESIAQNFIEGEYESNEHRKIYDSNGNSIGTLIIKEET